MIASSILLNTYLALWTLQTDEGADNVFHKQQSTAYSQNLETYQA
jgi:hypothetical protein